MTNYKENSEACSKDHASFEKAEDGSLKTINLCVENDQTQWLRDVIHNHVTLITCTAHQKQQVLNHQQ